MTRPEAILGWVALIAGLAVTGGAFLLLLNGIGKIDLSGEDLLCTISIGCSTPPSEPSRKVDWAGFWMLLLAGLTITLGATYYLLSSRRD